MRISCALYEKAIGDDIFLAGDAYMGWDRAYALEMARRLEKFNLAWIEEPLMVHDTQGYRELCRKSPIPIAHGEHLYNRFEFAEVIRNGAANILQPDINRVGGFYRSKKDLRNGRGSRAARCAALE